MSERGAGGVPPAYWLVSSALAALFLVFGLAIGAVFLARDVVVERPVEVERIVERKVEMAATLTEGQQRKLNIGEAFLAAVEKPNVAYRETAVMPTLGKVKVVVLMSEDLATHLSRQPFEREVAAALAESGVSVSKLSDKEEEDFNTTVFVVVELMVQDSTGNLVGEIQLNVNQTMLAFAGGVYRKINVPTMSFGRTVAYGRDNFDKLPVIAGRIAKDVATVLLKADEVGRRETAGK